MKSFAKYSSLLFFVAFLTLTSSCGQKSDVKELEAEVMAIHDEVMPKMGTLMDLKKKLRARAESLDTIQATAKKDSLLVLIKGLEEADEAMMQWMRTYKKPSEDMPEKEVVEYLNQEMEEIQKVKAKINSSEEAAKVALQ